MGSASRWSSTPSGTPHTCTRRWTLPFREIRYVLLAIPGAPGASSSCSNTGVIETMPAAARPSDPGSGHLCLQVQDAGAAHARMTALGYRARSAGPVDVDSGINAGGKIVYFADPDGFWVELLERPGPWSLRQREHLPMTTVRDDLAGLDGPVRIPLRAHRRPDCRRAAGPRHRSAPRWSSSRAIATTSVGG